MCSGHLCPSVHRHCIFHHNISWLLLSWYMFRVCPVILFFSQFSLTIEGSVRPVSLDRDREWKSAVQIDWLYPCRAQNLQSARDAYDEYRHGYDHMLQFLSSIPNYEPQETDSLSQMETKLKNQKVGQLHLLLHPQGGQGGRRTASPFPGREQAVLSSTRCSVSGSAQALCCSPVSPHCPVQRLAPQTLMWLGHKVNGCRNTKQGQSYPQSSTSALLSAQAMLWD